LIHKTIRGTFERPAGSGVWWISYRDGAGKRHREKIGRLDDALAASVDRRRQVLEGRYVPPQSRKRSTTFRELAGAAMDHRKLRLRPRSYRTDVSRLDAMLPIIGAAPAEGFSADAIDKVLDGLRHRGLTGSTANRYRSLLSSIFAYGVRTGRVGSNPLRLVKRFREGESRVRYLLRDEEILLRAAVLSNCPEREPELDLALYTGMRRGEQFTLKWKDVDLDRGILTVRGKTGRRHIVINSSARSAIERLAKHRRDPAALFVCPDTQSEVQTDWRRWFEKSCRAAGIEDFHWHDLRHTFASRLVMAGVDIRTVQELLGHKSITMTMRYSHLSPDHRQAAAEKIGGSAAVEVGSEPYKPLWQA
jgi:site-specific recombinase XerD